MTTSERIFLIDKHIIKQNMTAQIMQAKHSSKRIMTNSFTFCLSKAVLPWILVYPINFFPPKENVTKIKGKKNGDHFGLLKLLMWNAHTMILNVHFNTYIARVHFPIT